MQYEAAYYLYKNQGMTRTEEERAVLYAPSTKDHQFGSGQMYREEFDVDLFFLYLEQDRETIEDRNIFFEKKRHEY